MRVGATGSPHRTRGAGWPVVVLLLVPLLLPVAAATSATATATATPGNGAELTIRAWLCPPNTGGSDAGAVCREPDRFPSYSLSGPVAGEGFAYRNGTATVTGLPTGRYAVAALVKPFVVATEVVCFPAGDPGRSFFSRMADLHTLDIALGAGERVVCDWYRRQIAHPRPGAPVPPPRPMADRVHAPAARAAPAALAIRSHVCPAGYTGRDLGHACLRLDTYRSFVLGGATGAATQWNETFTDGQASFIGIAPGLAEIAGGVPAAFVTETVVVCATDAAPGSPFSADPVGPRHVELWLNPGETVWCDWWSLVHTDPPSLDPRFAPAIVASQNDLLAGQTASLTIQGWRCPSGNGGFAETSACIPDPAIAPAFGLVHAESAALAERLVASNRDGEMGFTDLPPGPVWLTSQPPIALDFIDYRVGCEDQRDPGRAVPVDDTGNGFGLALAPGDRVVCRFYSGAREPAPDPAATGSLTLYAARCPPGYVGADHYRDCYATPFPGAVFTLRAATDASFRAAETGTDGFAAFPGLAGTYTLRLATPGESRAGCSAAGHRVPLAPAPDGTGYVLAISAADDLRCDWYHLPPQ